MAFSTPDQLIIEAAKLINSFIREEFIKQGHTLRGELERSIQGQLKKNGDTTTIDGLANYYWVYTEYGFPHTSASFKQFPFLLKYFLQRGFPAKEVPGGPPSAGALAAMTIHKWMKEVGMPTEASKRFSQTGARKKWLEQAFAKNERRIDDFMENGIDDIIETWFKEEKDEVIG